MTDEKTVRLGPATSGATSTDRGAFIPSLTKPLLIGAILSIGVWGCSETNRPRPEEMDPPLGDAAGRIDPDDGLGGILGDLFVHTTAGSTHVRLDGTFEATFEDPETEQPVVVVLSDGTPILLAFAKPADGPLLLGTRATAEALLAIDPFLRGVVPEARKGIVDRIREDLGPVIEEIRSRLREGRLTYLVREDDLEVHRSVGMLLRGAIPLADVMHPDSLAASGPPWVESGEGDEDAPVIVNPYTIHYGVELRSYYGDQRRQTFTAGRSELEGLFETGPAARTAIDVPGERYRLLLRNGRTGSWDGPDAPGFLAARRNIVEAATFYVRDVLRPARTEGWMADPARFGMTSLQGIETVRSSLSGGDPIGFQIDIAALVVKNAKMLIPDLSLALAMKVDRIAAVHTTATRGMRHGRFITDLFDSPVSSDSYVRIEGGTVEGIDPPLSIRPPANLTAHQSGAVVYLDWEDRANNEDGYTVERREDGFYQNVAGLIEGADGYADGQIRVGATYTYRVVAHNQAAQSALSNEAAVTINNLNDLVPPGAVLDLSVGEVSAGSIELIWTAPGDDLGIGSAEEYDIRYSSTVLTDETWDQARQALNEFWPRPAGSVEHFLVIGLRVNTGYSFALKTRDEKHNWSALSNILTV